MADRFTLRVASWNIHGGREYADVLAGLRSLQADVLALQEVDVRWGDRSAWRDIAGDLARDLGYSVAYGPTIEHWHETATRRYGLAVLSRYPITEVHRHPLSAGTPYRPGEHETEPRIALEVRLALPHGELRAISSHLSPHMEPPDRLRSSLITHAQARELRRVLDRDPRTPTLLGVDLNATSESPEWAALFSGSRYRALNDPAQPTWPTSDYAWREVQIAAQPGHCIDWLIGAGVEPSEVETRTLPGSDHRALVATVTLAR